MFSFRFVCYNKLVWGDCFDLRMWPLLLSVWGAGTAGAMPGLWKAGNPASQ